MRLGRAIGDIELDVSEMEESMERLERVAREVAVEVERKRVEGERG